MYKVYGDYRSGNCYKIKLAMSLLGIDYQWVPVDILKGETQTPEFLTKNPNGKIPVLEPGGRQLPVGVQRHPQLPRRRQRPVAQRTAPAHPGAAMAILRAIQP